MTETGSGSLVSGQNVVFSWKVTGSSQAPQTDATSGTDASGQATYTLNGSGDRRTITVTATLQSDSSKTASVDIQFGAALPSGFIALSSSASNWSGAGAYCASQGGRLPRIKGLDSLATTAVSSGDAVDGFGTLDGPWPSALPSGSFWTGTELTDYTGISWIVGVSGGYVDWLGGSQAVVVRVVCVP
ncbi:hypothetical protein FACS189475_01050 [Betaproteobacteria bacterium]|nr:hypothetical protein FACS189475_01050 [Betaproteobacteria bacterium]